MCTTGLIPGVPYITNACILLACLPLLPGTPSKAAEEQWNKAPQATLVLEPDTAFTVYKGEEVFLNPMVWDKDTQTIDCNTWEMLQYNHEIAVTITGKASFDPSESVKTKTVADWYPCLAIYIDAGFTAQDTISIVVKAKDLDQGDKCDNDAQGVEAQGTYTLTWKDKCPTDLTCTSPDYWSAEQPLNERQAVEYEFLLKPDLGAAGPRDYENISIGEDIGEATSNLDPDKHVTPLGRQNKPENDKAAWEKWFMDGEKYRRGTFLPDETDTIADEPAFAWTETLYLVLQPTVDLYYDLPQTYTCTSDAGNLSKAYTLRMKLHATTGNRTMSRTESE